MFKLVITLINHETGDKRKLVHNRRYNSRELAWKDAQKMAYVHKNDGGSVTHECCVKIMGVNNGK